MCTDDGQNWKLGLILDVNFELETHTPIYLVVLDEDVEDMSKDPKSEDEPERDGMQRFIDECYKPGSAKEFRQNRVLGVTASDNDDEGDGDVRATSS